MERVRGYNRVMEFEGVMNLEYKCFPLLMGPLGTILGTWPTEVLYNGCPSIPISIKTLPGQECDAFCPGCNSCLQNNSLLLVPQAQCRPSKLPLMQGLLTLPALVPLFLILGIVGAGSVGRAAHFHAGKARVPGCLNKSSDGNSSQMRWRSLTPLCKLAKLSGIWGLWFKNFGAPPPIPQLNRTKSKTSLKMFLLWQSATKSD